MRLRDLSHLVGNLDGFNNSLVLEREKRPTEPLHMVHVRGCYDTELCVLTNALAMSFLPSFFCKHDGIFGVSRGQINERLEFPFELNMYPFTKEGLAAATAAQDSSNGADVMKVREDRSEVVMWMLMLWEVLESSCLISDGRIFNLQFTVLYGPRLKNF